MTQHSFVASGLTAGNTGIQLCATCGASERLGVHQTKPLPAPSAEEICLHCRMPFANHPDPGLSCNPGATFSTRWEPNVIPEKLIPPSAELEHLPNCSTNDPSCGHQAACDCVSPLPVYAGMPSRWEGELTDHKLRMIVAGLLVPNQAMSRRLAFDLLKVQGVAKSALDRAERLLDEAGAADVARSVDACDLPPKGWVCTRGPGHSGPCAAIEVRR